MTKGAALKDFWSSFGLKAYEENSVPSGGEKPDFPYITYQFATDSYGKAISLSASVWYRTPGWSVANAKAEEISAAIRSTGKLIKIDNGYIVIRRGTPFANRMGDPSDDMIKRVLLNITAEYWTNN